MEEQVEIQTLSKALVKKREEEEEFTLTYVDYEHDQNIEGLIGGGGGDEGSELTFIISPWSTKCLVANNYLYNCHSSHGNKTYWR